MKAFHEKIQYLELPCSKMDASKSFFKKVFSWSFTSYGEEYLAFKSADAGIEGGFFKSDQQAQTKNGSALVVFYSRDLESTQKKIIDHGGNIVKDTFYFPGGRRFHFYDPSENEFAVWSDLEPTLKSHLRSTKNT